jgi:hypothetical protein
VPSFSFLEIACAFRMTTIAIKLYCISGSFAGGAAIFLPLWNRAATGRILAGLSLFLFSHFYSFLSFSIDVTGPP